MLKKGLLFFTVLFACLIPRWYLLPYLGVRIYHMRVSIYCMALFLLLISVIFVRKDKNISISGEKDIIIFFVWFFVSALLILKTKDYSESISSLYYLFLGLLSVLVMNLAIREMESIKICFGAVFCGLVLHLVIGYLEVLLNRHFFAVGTNDTYYLSVYPVSIFYNNNDYGAFIIVLLPLALAFLKMTSKRVPARFLSVLLLLVSLFIVVYAQSDTLQIGLIFVVIIGIGVFLSKKFGSKMVFLYVFSLISIVVIGGLIASDYIKTVLDETMYQERVRVNLLRNGFLFFWESKGLGIGYGNVQYYLQYNSVYDVYGVYFFHNWFFEILFCGGVIAFVGYMSFHINKLKMLLSFSKLRVEELTDTGGAIAYNPSVYVLISFVIFSAVCISSSSNLYSEWLWMYFGLISAYTNYFSRMGSENKKPKLSEQKGKERLYGVTQK